MEDKSKAVRLTPEVHKIAKKLAAKENRTITNFVNNLILKANVN